MSHFIICAERERIFGTPKGQAISQLRSRADRGQSLGAAGRMHALATFAPESVARRYIEVYRDAIASSPT